MANRDVLRFPIWPGRLPDNAILWFTDVASDQEFRFTPDQLPTGQRVGVNDRPSLWMQVRCYSIDTPQYEPNDATLVDLDQANMCLNTVITVDWGPDGYGRQYRVTFDTAGPLRVYKDGRFIGSPDIPASYVLVGSEAEAAAGVDVYDPEELRVPADAIRLHMIGALTLSFAAAVDLDADDFEDGIIPAPTGNLEADAGIWRQRPVSAPGYIGFQAVTVEAVRYLVSEEQLPIPRDYRLLRYNEQEPGDLTRPARAAYDVLVRVGTSTQLRPSAVRIDNETGALTEGTYRLDTDTFTAGSPGGGEFSAAALAAAMHPGSRVLLEDIDGQVYGDLAPGSVQPTHLSNEIQARLNPELLRVTAAGGAVTVYRTTDALAAALTGALAGSVVELQVPASLSQLVVKNAVRYVFGAAATTPSILTDDGQAADAYLEFAQQYPGPRRVVVANAATRLRVYGSLSGEGEPAITASAGTVEYSGQSYSRLANLSGAARFNKWERHFCGGDTGIIAAGTSVTHLYGEIQAGYERGVEASDSAQVHLHGDSAQTFGAWALAYFAFVTGSAQLHLYAGRHTSLARPYADLQTATAEIHLHPGAELPTPSEGVTIAGSGVVHLYAGCLIDETTIASTCTIVRHGTVASGGGGGGPQVVQSTGQSTTAVMSQKAVTEALASGGGAAPGADTSFCVVKVGSPGDVSGTGAQLVANVYQAVPLTQVVEDAGNNWNATTYEYTVPRTGLYLVLTEAFRLEGSLPAGLDFYFGAHTEISFGDQLLWAKTRATFNGQQHFWQPRLTAGQKVRLVAYLDGFTGKVQARMAIRFLSA
jgi:hypothetical protein